MMGRIIVMVLLCLFMLAPQAWAQQPPDKDPQGGVSQDIVQNWDRSAIPAEISLIAPKTLLAYNADPARGYGALHFTCASSSHAATGRCPVSDTAELGSYKGSIVLQLTEQRSGMVTEINVLGWLDRAESGRACNNYWQPQPRPLWTSAATPCITPASGTAVTLLIEESELRRLVAGRWLAQLHLTLRSAGGAGLAEYDFRFDLTITDRNAVAIYFPAFEHTTPLVQLSTVFDPMSHTIAGRTVLDMCLYDGLGSQAQYLAVTVRDLGPQPPGPTGFSLWHNQGGTDRMRRLDYTVSLEHNGATVVLPNGIEQQLHDIDTAKLRLVLLPGTSQPVYCVPTPITFEIPRVPISTQQPGTYFGDLRLELRVPTVTP